MGSISQYHPITTSEDGFGQPHHDEEGGTNENGGKGEIAMQSLELQQAEQDEEVRQNTRSLQSTLLAMACLLVTLVVGAIGEKGWRSMNSGVDQIPINASLVDGNSFNATSVKDFDQVQTAKIPKISSNSNVPTQNNISTRDSNTSSIIAAPKEETAISNTVTSEDPDIISNQTSTTNLKQIQINNYIQGKALLLNIHITHHAGTSVCSMMTKLGPTPGFACNGPGRKPEQNQDWPPNMTKQNKKSWSYEETADNVELFRNYFHFMSWEYKSWGNLHGTNWEYEDLVSMIVMRDPIERFLAGGKPKPFHGVIGGDPTEETQGIYWEYANSHPADNFALKVLADKNNCVNGADTPISCLESAQSLLRRFTFILDEACLAESMVALGEELDLNITVEGFEGRLHHEHPKSTRERIGNDTLYEFLQDRFRRDIELYQWSKTRSIVQCKQRF